MNYDQWKTASPGDEEKENNCGFCGNRCEGKFCSDYCRKADYDENCKD